MLAFGTLVGKSTTAKEDHSYPLTSVPLALSTEESGLRQGTKAMLRNHMIDETKAGEDEPPTRAEWLIDGMAAVQAVLPKILGRNMLRVCFSSVHSLQLTTQ